MKMWLRIAPIAYKDNVRINDFFSFEFPPVRLDGYRCGNPEHQSPAPGGRSV